MGMSPTVRTRDRHFPAKRGSHRQNSAHADAEPTPKKSPQPKPGAERSGCRPRSVETLKPHADLEIFSEHLDPAGEERDLIFDRILLDREGPVAVKPLPDPSKNDRS
jgi:hypothetical protein